MCGNCSRSGTDYNLTVQGMTLDNSDFAGHPNFPVYSRRIMGHRIMGQSSTKLLCYLVTLHADR